MFTYRLFAHHFKHEVNPDGSTRTECMCVFPNDNRKCQFVAVRDPRGQLHETLEKHLQKHHHEEFKAFQEWKTKEMLSGFARLNERMKNMHDRKEQGEATNNSSN
ncbi:hypothetical protein DdX_12337 [Ditylenchus destructor]|uniref:Uncharacterized protein n=1 Tax=Ditylenchus destructor TaxID=166010 RepID=A0AAD4MUW8_9BILA|nr:hypothetical protein DdX_12337 [Ditylenchus destructor]